MRTWSLESGWIRDFRTEGQSFQPFTRTGLAFPERAAYFDREVFEPKESSKLTYLELKDYITDLKKSGYNATELQVELYKKISFPLSCVVMAVLGIPFLFLDGTERRFLRDNGKYSGRDGVLGGLQRLRTTGRVRIPDSPSGRLGGQHRLRGRRACTPLHYPHIAIADCGLTRLAIYCQSAIRNRQSAIV